MDMQIAGKKALVTGAGRGLGEAIAKSLAAEGAHVLVCSRTASTVDRVVEALPGGGHLGVTIDLEREDAPAALLDRMERDFGWPDIVVHNVGGTLDINDPYCSLADWRRVWRFNMEIALELNERLIPPMRTKKWGRIVLISSISAMENHGPVPYCSVKAALTAYARSMGRVLSPDGIIMTAVLPGAVMTEGGYWDVASKERPEHVEKYLADRMAIRRFGRPEEISDFVAFLCSEHASFCVGSIIPIDGGQGRSYFGE
jgi:NAD(P)-dependent dehydrogenase (short-subunit alcohol dehydrogenase family)